MRGLGPGLVTGAADDDPSGIAAYSQPGAQFGFALNWTMLLGYPLIAAVQEIGARIARTTGGIAANIREHCPVWLLQPIGVVLVVANTINVDLDAMVDAAVPTGAAGYFSMGLIPAYAVVTWLSPVMRGRRPI